MAGLTVAFYRGAAEPHRTSLQPRSAAGRPNVPPHGADVTADVYGGRPARSDVRRRLYRFAYRDPETGDLAQVGRAYLSLPDARRGAFRQNAERRAFSLPLLSHVVVYVETGDAFPL